MSEYLLMPIIFFSSLILTMVGLGGGLIFSPLFVLLSFPVTTAVSASLFLNGIAAVGGSITYLRKKMVDLRVALPFLLSSALSAPLGAMAVTYINIRVFTGVLAGVILTASLRMLFFGKPKVQSGEVEAWKRISAGALIGAVIGAIAGLLGIGGGVFIVPLLVFALKVPIKTAAATSMFIVVFSSFSGFLAHASMGQTDWRFVTLAAIFSFAGGQVGSRIMAGKLQGRTVQRLFGVVLLIFCLKLIQRMLTS